MKRATAIAAAAAAAAAGCERTQSALAPGGPHAQAVADFAWILFAGGAVILVIVLAALALALYLPPARRGWLAGAGIVVAGGVVFPIVTLSAVLAGGLFLTRDIVRDTSPPYLVVDVVGTQWWWRVRYRADANRGVRAFETANELRIPVGRAVDVHLTTTDVIHSFWVPGLAGKLDMIPGHANRLRLQADVPGVYRGQCAEYCGGAHALMAFHVIALSDAEFAEWRARQQRGAAAPTDAHAREGERIFRAVGCAACHTVRGTDANGRIGPDLTHVGGRISLAAGLLPNEPDAFARWVAASRHVKPGNRMPPFEFLQRAELRALAVYLESLE